MTCVHGFPPIANRSARVLILGSMPGQASLDANAYYAHPQNAFWPIMGALVGADPALPYAVRIEALKSAGIALWDVLASCERKGSLDADIRADSIIVNDFASFFASHRKVTDVLFNGAMAEACFHRHAAPLIDAGKMRFVRMPSTSPANASISRSRKLEQWRIALEERGIITATC